MDVGKVLKYALLLKDIQQMDVAEKLGVSKQVLSRTLSRADMRVSEIQRIADAAGYDMRIQLMDRETGKVIDVD